MQSALTTLLAAVCCCCAAAAALLLLLQVQLNTLLVSLREAQPGQYSRVYELLADASHAVRHAVADLVAAMLEEQGQQVLQQQHAGAGGSKPGGGKKSRRKSGEADVASTSELQLAGLMQVGCGAVLDAPVVCCGGG